MRVGDKRPVPLTPGLKQEYERLYTTQVINLSYEPLIESGIAKITYGTSRYKDVEARTGVPWYVIGVLHLLECDSSFERHLHNGDPLKHKTVNVPVGRPLQSKWTWEDSAVDAIKYEAKNNWSARGLKPTDWSLGATLYRLEAWNGFGSRNHGVATPFLWSGTKFYTKGKYGSDGKWNPELRSQQIGAAVLLYTMNKRELIKFPINI